MTEPLNDRENNPISAMIVDVSEAIPPWTASIGTLAWVARKVFSLDDNLSDPIVVDENVIQRMLFTAADIIQQKGNFENTGTITLNKDSLGSRANKLKALRNQAQLLSDSIVPTGEIARSLFADSSGSVSIDSDYYIKNYVLMNMYESGRANLYYFDIDVANNTNIGRFFISKVVIKNNSTSSYTLRANFQVSLKIYFTSFEDLIGKYVTINKVGAPQISQQVPILYLLYKFMDRRELPSELRESVDKTGIIYNQTLYMKDGTRFDKFSNAYGKKVSKNYHLSYHKHSFDVFKSGTPFYKYYENELSIDYIAFESPELSKSEREKLNVPTPNGNLYELAVSETQIAEIKKRQQQLDVISQQLQQCKPGSRLDQDYFKQLETTVGDEEKKLIALVNDYNYNLIFSILNACKRYKVSGLTKKVLNIYSASNAREALMEVMTPGFIISQVANIASMVVGGPAGIAWGGFDLAMGAYQIISAMNSKKLISKSLSYSFIRAAFSNATIAVDENQRGTGDLERDRIEKEKTDDRTKKFFEDDISGEKRVEYIINKFAFATTLPREDQLDEPFEIYFTTFGEVLKVIKALAHRLGIITGGYVIEGPSGINFVNFANIPISIKTLSKFLYDHIKRVNRGFVYDTEVFLKDIYENLIKAIVYDGSSYLQKNEITISKNMKVGVSLHSGPEAESILLNTNKVDIIGADIENLKALFFKSKCFDFESSVPNLFSVYVFGAVEDTRMINFYNEFFSKNPGEVVLNTNKFQEYINTEHIMPCIITKKIATTESILKNKHLTFTRYDNANLQTGAILNGFGQMRMPYKISGELKAFMTFFIDMGSMLFVAPPSITGDAQLNSFGYGGLYGITSAQFEYVFQSISSDKITIPAFDSKLSIEGMVISPGDVTDAETEASSQREASRAADLCNSNLLGTTQASRRSDYGIGTQIVDNIIGIFTDNPGDKIVANNKPNRSAIEAYLRR